MRTGWMIAVALLAAGVPGAGPGAAAAAAPPAAIEAAVAATARRSPANVALDSSRKPAELLAFLGLEQGMRVIDMFGANKYWAEIMAPAIGPRGQLIVWQPSQFLNDQRRSEFAEFAARQANVTLISTPFEAPLLAVPGFDFMLIHLDYHDVYWESPEMKIGRMDPDAWLRTIYAAMKPGAVVGIVDHSAAPGGDVRAVVGELHRIDPAVVRADFERAGFLLEGTSELLRNPADDRKRKVFDPAIRGKTDRFIFKFRKPR